MNDDVVRDRLLQHAARLREYAHEILAEADRLEDFSRLLVDEPLFAHSAEADRKTVLMSPQGVRSTFRLPEGVRPVNDDV